MHTLTPECSALQPLRQQYAAWFTADTDTMRSFFAQQDHMQVFDFILGCLDFLNIDMTRFELFGKCDQIVGWQSIVIPLSPSLSHHELSW